MIIFQFWNISQKYVPYCPSNTELYNGAAREVVYDFTDSLNVTFIDKLNSAFEIHKYGSLCIARVSLSIVDGSLTGADVISSTAISAEYRPDFNIYAPVVSRNVGGWAVSTMASAVISIETNGTVTLRTGLNVSSAKYVIGTLVWHC